MISLRSLNGATRARVLSSFLVLAFFLNAMQPELSSASNRKSPSYFAVSITTQPASQTVVAGQSASFSVAVTGTAPLVYQWRKNGNAIYGATSSTYTVPPTFTKDTGSQFTVVVSNPGSKVASSAATLTVLAAPAVSTSTTSTSTIGTTSTSTTSSTTGTTTTSSTTGTAALVLTPAALSLGIVTIGGSNSLAVTLVNSGTASASITNVSISGPGFGVSGVPVGQTLAPAQSVILNVIFAPASAGGVTGSVTVTSNASNPSVVLAVSGTGVQPPVSHSASLNWSPSSSVVVGYKVYRSTVSGGSYTVLTTAPVNATSYLDNGVQAGSTYYYVATSVDGSNTESSYSNEIAATVP